MEPRRANGRGRDAGCAPRPAPRLPLYLASCALAGLCGVLFLHRLGERDLWSSHEARAAMDAESLLAADSPGWPRLHDGRLELQKPPLFYWLAAGAARLRGGVDALAVRLPAALAGLGVVLAVALGVGVGFRRPAAGLLAGFFLATGAHFPWLARIGRIDMPLTLTTTLAAGGFAFALAGRRPWGGCEATPPPKPEATPLTPNPCSPPAEEGEGSKRRRGLGGGVIPQPLTSLLTAYLACAAGVLLKGPVGLALPAAAVVGFLWAEGRWPACWEFRAWAALLRRLGVWWGLPLVLLVVVPVFVWAQHLSGGQLGREFFWKHNVERALGGATLRSHFWGMYAGYFLVYFLPYSPLVVLAVLARSWRGDPLSRLGLAWGVAVLLLLSCARFKRADYLVPAYPGFAVFLACAVERRLGAPGGRRVLAGVLGLGGVMAAGWLVRLGWVLPRQEPFRDYRPFAAEVRRHAPAPACVAFFRTEAHALAFRVGRPLHLVVEWPELRARLRQAGPHYLVTPPECAAECRQQLPGARVEEVCRNTALAGGRHERPLVLLRVR
jgi:4-amino-4-deoxy-L-arabinose transferase-like glycosyltransferase